MSLILKCKTMSVKYDSSINVLGSIPDYLSMMDFICEYHGRAPEGQGSFAFRTHKTFARFEAAIKAAIMRFAGDEHKQLFLDALSSCDLSSRERLMVLFWQIVYCNPLFRRISEDVFMKAVYQARANLSALDVLALLHHIKETEKRELEWSEATLKMCASKYLTILKKLELADGAVKKRIIYPPMTSRPVKDINIIGNGPQALADIVAVGDDLQIDNGAWTCGKGQSCPVSCGIPTVLINKLTVGGE